MDERGIVLTFQMDSSKGGGLSGKIDSMELRKHLLYWDFIDFPTVNGIGTNLRYDSDASLLKEQGFLRQTEVSVPSHEPPGTVTVGKELFENVLLVGQYKVLNQYQQKNIICSISQYNVNLEVPKSLQKEIAILEMELINCLPYPTSNTRIADILEFKERRKDNLMMLRYKLDELYLLASANINDLRAKDRSIHELKVAISDINKLFNESKIKSIYSSFKVLLKIPFEIFGGYLIGEAAAPILNLSLFEAGLLGAGVGAVLLNASPKQIFGPKSIPSNKKDFAYLYHAQKELGTMSMNP